MGEFDINYLPRPSIKAQVLVDFILECTILDEEHNDGETAPMPDECCIFHIYGSLNITGSGAGLILTNPDRVVVEYALCFEFFASNNEVEYEALVTGMRMTKKLRVRHLRCYSDSQLIVG